MEEEETVSVDDDIDGRDGSTHLSKVGPALCSVVEAICGEEMER